MTAVLIVSGREDVHALRVAQELHCAGKQVRFLDMRELGRTASISHGVGGPGTCSVTVGGEEPIPLSEIDAVWLRRPNIPYLPATVSDIAHRRFARLEWKELIDGAFLSMRARFVNPYLAQVSAVKPRQLEVAQRVGLNVPDTLITSDAADAGAFVDAHGRVIHKTLSAHPDKLLDTRRWTERDRNALQELSLAPSIFQQEICGPADIRVTVVGVQVFALRVCLAEDQDRVDGRLNVDAPSEPHRLPEQVEEQLLTFMRELGLVFGTVDMRIAHDGRYFFLEVNPQGQFLYVEILTGMPISAAVAELLANGRDQG